jgi:hypothetical protein
MVFGFLLYCLDRLAGLPLKPKEEKIATYLDILTIR